MNVFYFFVIFTFKFSFSKCCPSQCVCTSSYLNCTNFDSFSDLNFKSIKSQKYDTIELRPSKKILLDSSLNLNCLTVTKQVILYNILGFHSNPFNEWHNLDLKLYESNFDFGPNCSVKDFNETIFDTFSRITLAESVNHTKHLCPLIFGNNTIDQILLFSMKSNNNLIFKKVDENFSPTINQLFLYNNEIQSLNDGLLEPNIFQKLKTLQIFGKLNSIDEFLFNKFSNLKYLSFELLNFGEFVSNMDWLSSLPANLVLGLSDSRKIFDFSERSFCLFRKFPQQRTIIPILKSKILENCTCTVIWLIKNSFENKLIKTQTVESCLSDRKTFYRKIEECKFEVKLKDCEQSGMINLKTSSTLNSMTTSKDNTKENIEQNNSIIKTFALVIGSVGFLTISAIMGLFLFMTR